MRLRPGGWGGIGRDRLRWGEVGWGYGGCGVCAQGRDGERLGRGLGYIDRQINAYRRTYTGYNSTVSATDTYPATAAAATTAAATTAAAATTTAATAAAASAAAAAASNITT